MQPRRSVLYMPGSNARAIEKARSLDADAIILDLEDSVGLDAKNMARQQVHDAVRAGGFGSREVIIRINGWSTPFGHADFDAAIRAKPDAILIPKVETVQDLQTARALAPGENAIALWAMIETPLAILNIKEIAAAAKADVLPLTCFVLGTNDLVKATRVIANQPRTALLPWLMMSVAAARAFGLTVIDGVYNTLSDEQGFRAECEQGRMLGMDGKTLVHPNQIAACNEIFSPSTEEIEAAQAIVAAFEKPENIGKGVITVDGKMVEQLHADMARTLLAMAAAIETRLR